MKNHIVDWNEKIGVLLTGATGFIGSNLAMNLLLEDRYRIYCLVRPMGNSQERLADAVMQSAKAAGMVREVLPRLSYLIAVEGDLASPQLGLSSQNRYLLAEARISQVWHCGASLRYEEKCRNEIFIQNIEGTKNTVEVAKQLHVTEFNHISTAYVAGKKQGPIREAPYDAAYEPNNCYEESKRSAEDVVVAASLEGFFHARIFRPSIVIGNIRTYDSTSSSGYYGFVSALDRFLSWIKENMPDYLEKKPYVTIYREEGAMLNLMPVDVLVHEALAAASGRKVSPEYHHLTNPHPATIDLAISAINKVYGGIVLKATSDLGDLTALDLFFKSKTDFYNPYINGTQTFENNLADSRFSQKLLFDRKALVLFTEKFPARFHEERVLHVKEKLIQVLPRKEQDLSEAAAQN